MRMYSIVTIKKKKKRQEKRNAEKHFGEILKSLY